MVATAADKVLQERADRSAPNENDLKVASQRLSQASGTSKKRSAAELEAGQQALEPVDDKVANEGEDNEKRTKEQ